MLHFASYFLAQQLVWYVHVFWVVKMRRLDRLNRVTESV
jgi:hypothetical protein